MSRSYWNGHEIECLDGIWIYSDTKEIVEGCERACGKCKKMPVNGHDACIVNLPGVKNACCGHGTDTGYIQFDSGVIIRGKFEIEKG